MDQCSGAVTGARLPFTPAPARRPSGSQTPTPSPTLNPSQARDALPAGGVYLEGILARIASMPRNCVVDADCGAYYGGDPTVQCVDLDTQVRLPLA